MIVINNKKSKVQNENKLRMFQETRNVSSENKPPEDDKAQELYVTFSAEQVIFTDAYNHMIFMCKPEDEAHGPCAMSNISNLFQNFY